MLVTCIYYFYAQKHGLQKQYSTEMQHRNSRLRYIKKKKTVVTIVIKRQQGVQR